MYESEKIYDDIDAAGIESLALTQLHRPVDAAITAADAEGASYLLDHVYTGQQDLNFFQEHVKSYIIIPATVFGRSKNGFTEAYLQNTLHPNTSSHSCWFRSWTGWCRGLREE